MTEISPATSTSETSRYALSVRKEETTSLASAVTTDAVDTGAFLVGEATFSRVVGLCVDVDF